MNYVFPHGIQGQSNISIKIFLNYLPTINQQRILNTVSKNLHLGLYIYICTSTYIFPRKGWARIISQKSTRMDIFEGCNITEKGFLLLKM